MTPPRRGDFKHVVPLTVRWADMDALGHVNNAKFFTYDETARLDYFSRLMAGDDRFWKDYGLILARIECDFLAQLRAPAEVQIGMRIARIGNSSLRTEGCIFLGEQAVAVSHGVVVWFDYPANRPLPVPDSVRAAIRRYETTPPDET